jgi:hypothetical protein
MPQSQKLFTVTIAERAAAAPVVITYKTLEEAMRAANGFRVALAPKEGGRVTVKGRDGKELQAWIEHPLGAHFTHPGGFHTS